MKIVQLIQGTPEWYAHRAQHFNASDAPAMLGVSPYKSRAQLLREYATGITPEIDAGTQRRFDDGHRYEALARPLAEEIIGEELYPCVGVEGKYSASFDGLTLAGDTAFEHKSLNDDLRAVMVEGCTGADLPEHYRVQMEHQCMVSGAEKVLFMASRWDADGNLAEKRHCWYQPDPELRARIVAGWEQFAADAAAYQPEPQAAPAPVGRAPEQLPALRIEVTGMVTASNLEEWKAAAVQVIRSVNTNLQTDQDFADAEQAVKWCSEVESRLKAAKEHALSQTASIDQLFRTIDEISAEARAKRLDLEKLVKRRKDEVRAEIVARAKQSVIDHLNAINATLGAHAIGIPLSLTADIAAAIKGRKTLASITDAANAAAAEAKIALSQMAEETRACIAVLDEFSEHAHLFADRVLLCSTKTPEDLRNLATARVAEWQKREQERLEAERERIRREEAERLQKQPAPPPAAEPDPEPVLADLPGAGGDVLVRLGDINAAIAPLTITADGLAKLGFQPAATERSAKLYAASDFPRIRAALARVIQQATIPLSTMEAI